MRDFKLGILTPTGEAFTGEIKELSLRTTAGEVGILAGHTDYLAGVTPCVLKIVDAEEKTRYAFCGGGFFSMTAGEATLVADDFLFAAEMDETQIADECTDLATRLSAAKDKENQQFLKLELDRAEAKRKAIEAQKDMR